MEYPDSVLHSRRDSNSVHICGSTFKVSLWDGSTLSGGLLSLDVCHVRPTHDYYCHKLGVSKRKARKDRKVQDKPATVGKSQTTLDSYLKEAGPSLSKETVTTKEPSSERDCSTLTHGSSEGRKDKGADSDGENPSVNGGSAVGAGVGAARDCIHTRREILFCVASSETDHVIVKRNDISRFLQLHKSHSIAFFGAALQFWVLDDHLRYSTKAPFLRKELEGDLANAANNNGEEEASASAQEGIELGLQRSAEYEGEIMGKRGSGEEENEKVGKQEKAEEKEIDDHDILWDMAESANVRDAQILDMLLRLASIDRQPKYGRYPWFLVSS